METVNWFVEFILHVDHHLRELVEYCGPWTYAVLFLVIFCETGLVVTPFLPGDSLLFAAGALAAADSLNFPLLLLALLVAAVLGDTVNYTIGRTCGEWLVHRGGRFGLKPQYLEQTTKFFDKYGGKTIVIARFVPIVRTFAPFMAGMAKMRYAEFMAYNVIGGVAWVVLCATAGYLFGQIPVVQEHFSLVVLGILVVSVLPVLWEIAQHRLHARRVRAASMGRAETPQPH